MSGSVDKKANYEFRPDGYLIVTGAQGIELEVDDAVQLLDAASTHFGGRFGLISNRVNEYRIDLGVFEVVGSYPGLVAIAAVLYHERSFPDVKMETRYVRAKPYATFFSLEAAEGWMRDQLARAAKD